MKKHKWLPRKTEKSAAIVLTPKDESSKDHKGWLARLRSDSPQSWPPGRESEN